MTARGYYGYHGYTGRRRAIVGARLVHTLELKQRYDNAKTAAVQSLLSTLSRDGVVSSVGPNRWEIALKDGAWVVLVWYPDYSALEVTVTDRELRDVDQMPRIRSIYEAILAKVTPHLRTYGVTTVGSAFYADVPVRAYVGQGSIIPHTPGEIEDELDQFHNELMSFGAELSGLTGALDEQARAASQKERDAARAAEQLVESFQPQVREIYRLEELLNEAGLSKRMTEGWRIQGPPYTNILATPMVDSNGVPIPRVEDLKRDFVAAKEALDRIMPRAERQAAIKRHKDLVFQASQAVGKRALESPLRKWERNVFEPFFAGWNSFYRNKKDIPAQTLPGSGTWDRIQEYRRQFADLRSRAPFQAQGATPLDPTSRSDPSITGGLRSLWGGAGDVFNIAKWGLIGALGIGAVVVLASVASKVRSGKDPAESYVGLVGRRRGSPRALPAPARRALPAGEPEVA